MRPFKTPYCHMIERRSTQEKFSSRLEIARYAQANGIKATVRRYGAARNTVRTWLRRYASGGSANLTDRREGPKHIPHKTSPALEQEVVKARQTSPCFGPKRLRWAYELPVGESAIARILKAHKLTRRRRKRYQRKQDLRAKKAQYQALTHHQYDLKHLCDQPEYWPQCQARNLPTYQWTLRDTKSGFTTLAFGNEYSEYHSSLVITAYLNHVQQHGIEMSNVTIQTDNGSEFGGAKRRIVEGGFSHLVQDVHGATHQFIPPKMPNANADVESFHSTIELEFYDLETFRSRDEFFRKAQEYQTFYNLIRPNYSKSGKTPWQIIQEDRPHIDPSVLLFPVIDVDALFRKITGLSGGQGLHELPEALSMGLIRLAMRQWNMQNASLAWQAASISMASTMPPMAPITI